MTDATAPLVTLSTKLCPWLLPALEQVDAARTSGRLGHAWLFAGGHGIGKINLALAFANRLLERTAAAGQPPILGPDEALAAMRDRHAPADHHPDLHWLFPEEEKKTISIEQIRSIADALNLKAHRGSAKVVIIEPADGMTTAAANALLKTLEEPSGDTYLLLVSHRPERLAATIRSRCQRLSIARPGFAEVAAWLGSQNPQEVAALWVSTGGSPLRIAELLHSATANINSSLEDGLVLISKEKVDPQIVADEWAKLDCDLVLSWLTRRIQWSIRNRLAPHASNPVTDLGHDTLHNAWAGLTVRRLFEQHQAAEKLLDQLGGGTNVELALRALLLGFAPNRGHRE